MAALLVVMAHYWIYLTTQPSLLGFSFTGVDLFFVLSGFVFAPYFFGRPLQPIPHYVRRVFRIYPLYLAALGLYAALKVMNGQDLRFLGEHLFMLHTLQNTQIAFYYNPAFWSLPPEMEFYLVLPLLVKAAASRRNLLLLGWGALALHLCIAWALPAQAESGAALVLSANLPGRGVEFALGVAAWRLARRDWSLAWRLGLVFAATLGWFVLGSIWLHLGDDGIAAQPLLRGNVSLLAACSFAVLVAACAGWVRSPPALLQAAAQWGGNLSYGIYLFHNALPVLVLKAWPHSQGGSLLLLSLSGTLLVAFVVHQIIEAPARAYGRALGRRMGRVG